MKLRLGFVEGKHGVLRMNTVVYRQYLIYEHKNCFGKTRVYLLIWPTHNFDQLHFRPKLQTLEKNVAENGNFRSTPSLLPEMAENFRKKIWWMF